ncbi:MAG: Histone acetyltransferase [Candidatus Eremiobacteraeota bacterium]|nr:Histone acetyltransferase [Candidatus Eremiobacteraeota bacterium]
MRIEPFDPRRDDVGAVTALLHAAYGRYAALGYEYRAATQDETRTLERLTTGLGLIARGDDGSLLGTVTYYALPPARDAQFVAWYRRADVGSFGQFAVVPASQGTGIGVALLDAIGQRARDDGKNELACETLLANQPLVAYYHRRGFRSVATFEWDDVRGECVVLSKAL